MNPSILITPNAVKAGKLYSVIPNNGTGDLDVVRATSATRVNEQGLIEIPRTNLVLRSEEFENAYWVKFNTTVTANITTSPSGVQNADKITPNAINAYHSVVTPYNISSTNSITASAYFKADGYNFAKLLIMRDAPYSNYYRVVFNLSNGTISTVDSVTYVGTQSITSVGNGWYRCAITVTNAVVNNTHGLEIGSLSTSPDVPFIGNGTSGTFCWGAQIEAGNVATEYIPTTSVIRTRFAGITQDGGSASNIPRLDYTNGSCPSILVEPQRTNTIRNSTMQGTGVGTPGTLPTNWAQGGGGGSTTTRTIIGTGIENGLTYIDIRYQGTVGGQLRLIEESSTTQPAAVGTNITISNYIKLVSGTAPQVQLVISNRDASNSYLSDNSGTFFNLTNSLTRYEFSATISQIGTAFAQPLIQWAFPGGTYDFTIRVAAPQLEVGSNATSYIPTTTATVTRNADVISKSGISSLIGQTEGTIFLEFIPKVLNSDIARICPASNNYSNGFFIYINQTGNLQFIIRANNSNVISSIIAVNISNTPVYKVVLKYSSGNIKIFVNGFLRSTHTATYTFSLLLDSVFLDNAQWTSANQTRGINTLALWKTQITDQQAIQLTTL